MYNSRVMHSSASLPRMSKHFPLTIGYPLPFLYLPLFPLFLLLLRVRVETLVAK